MGCLICGAGRTDGAHIYPEELFKKEFGPSIDDRVQNIIPLCKRHHSMMDNDHRIAIIPNKTGFLIMDDLNGEVVVREHLVNSGVLKNIKDDYIQKRNLLSCPELQVTLSKYNGI